MRAVVFLLLPLCVAADALAYDVTSAEARKHSLLEYVAGRGDLGRDEVAAWDKAIRVRFGGKAVQDGSDEGVTAAKSVISAAIFQGVDAKRGAQAAFDAYHDTNRFVPPPVAIEYQVLAFQGHKPKATARQLAFDFPRYFNEEIAPDLASWWDEMLAAGKIPALDEREIRRVLAETRALMRPMLREKLWQAAELEARLGPGGPEVKRELDVLAAEIARDFRGVGKGEAVRSGPFYSRYAALSRELGAAPLAPPKAPAARVEPPPAPKPSPPPMKMETPAPKLPPKTPRAESPTTPDDATAPPAPLAPTRPAAPAPSSPQSDRSEAPLPGEPLLPPPPRWPAVLDAKVSGWIGTPYVWGGTDKRGVDCSGFTRGVLAESLGLELPRNSRAQYGLGVPVQQQQLSPGDLVFFDTLERGRVTHVGVYVGDGVIAHASSSKGVSRAELGKAYYQRAYWGSRRILDVGR